MTTPKRDTPGTEENDKKILVAGSLSQEQVHDSATRRVELITKEFSEGFEFLEDYPKTVTVFGSSMITENSPFYEMARSLCKKIAGIDYSVITGGGPGIMEAANRGAFEAHGRSLGITIKLPHEQTTNSYVTDKIALTYFFARKVCLSFSAEAYIFFPGGFGTLDEFFEILTLVQTKKVESVPIILVGSEYWRPLEKFILNEVLSRGMIDSEDMNLFFIEDNEQKILDIIQKSPIRNGVKYDHSE